MNDFRLNFDSTPMITPDGSRRLEIWSRLFSNHFLPLPLPQSPGHLSRWMQHIFWVISVWFSSTSTDASPCHLWKWTVPTDAHSRNTPLNASLSHPETRIPKSIYKGGSLYVIWDGLWRCVLDDICRSVLDVFWYAFKFAGLLLVRDLESSKRVQWKKSSWLHLPFPLIFFFKFYLTPSGSSCEFRYSGPTWDEVMLPAYGEQPSAFETALSRS